MILIFSCIDLEKKMESSLLTEKARSARPVVVQMTLCVEDDRAKVPIFQAKTFRTMLQVCLMGHGKDN